MVVLFILVVLRIAATCIVLLHMGQLSYLKQLQMYPFPHHLSFKKVVQGYLFILISNIYFLFILFLLLLLLFLLLLFLLILLLLCLSDYFLQTSIKNFEFNFFLQFLSSVVRASISRFVRPSVRPSVTPSVPPQKKLKFYDTVQIEPDLENKSCQYI